MPLLTVENGHAVRPLELLLADGALGRGLR